LKPSFIKILSSNEDLDFINESIDKLLNEQTGNPIINFFLRGKIKDMIWGSDEEVDDSNKDKEERAERARKEYEEWQNSENKEKDIEDTVEDIKDVLDIQDDKAVDEFREMLKTIAEKQKKVFR